MDFLLRAMPQRRIVPIGQALIESELIDGKKVNAVLQGRRAQTLVDRLRGRGRIRGIHVLVVAEQRAAHGSTVCWIDCAAKVLPRQAPAPEDRPERVLGGGGARRREVACVEREEQNLWLKHVQRRVRVGKFLTERSILPFIDVGDEPAPEASDANAGQQVPHCG